MAQRVLIATCLVVTAASLALVGMFWMQSTGAARDLAETNRRMVEALTENQATNRELLKQLQSAAKCRRHQPYRNQLLSLSSSRKKPRTARRPPVARSRSRVAIC